MTLSAASSAPAPFDRPPRLPTAVGPYRILAVLGEGGMGTVYLAEQPVPRREVALKVIRADLASPRLLRRFEREAEVLGRLEHPGIAQVFEAGTAEQRDGDDGPAWTVPYIAMARVVGVPLTEHPKARGDVRDRVRLLLLVCEAVQYAHQRGVIHRDLKPGNILVDAEGMPKVLDFGIARLSDGDPQASTATGLGEVLGSLPYMSPEQVTGDPLDVDVRSDVYALGVLLFEVLAGRRPLLVDAQSFPSALRMILSDEPPRLSAVAPPALASVVRGDLETIVAAALDKEKDRRYASAQALADDLRRWLRDEPIAARPASAAYQLRKFARRNRALVGGAVLAAAALVVGTGVSAWQAVRATAAERVATAQRAEALAARGQAEARGREAVAAGALAEQRRLLADAARAQAEAARAASLAAQAAAERNAAAARREAAKALAVNAFLGEMLAAGDPENARGRDVTVREVVDRAARRVAGGSLAGQPDVEALVRYSLGNTYHSVGSLDSALAQMTRAAALHRTTLGARDLQVARDAFRLGVILADRGDHAGARRSLETAIALLRASRDPARDATLVPALSQLAYEHYTADRHDDAARVGAEAVAIARRRAAGRPTEMLGSALGTLGSLRSYVATALPEGVALLREAVAVLRAVGGPVGPQLARTELDLAYALSRTRSRPDLLEAVRVGRDAYEHVRQLYPEGSLTRGVAASRLADALAAADSLQAAEVFMRDALRVRIAALGAENPDVAYTRERLGFLLLDTRRYAEAETLLTQALATRRALLGDRHGAVASSLQALGLLAFARGDTAAAVPLFLAASERWPSARPAANDQYRAAQGALSVGRLAMADSLARGIVARDTVGGVRPVIVVAAADLLGRVAIARADTAGAEQAWTSAWTRAGALLGRGPEGGRIAQRLAALCERRACAVDAATWRARAAAP